MPGNDLLTLTAEVVSAHVAPNTVAASELAELIRTTYDSLNRIGGQPEPEPVKQEPAVPIRSSVKPDYLACLEDGTELKMLKRHLATHHSMTVAEYRAKWDLPADYPMAAPNFAEKRRSLAKKIGLGRKPAPAPAKPGRKAAADAPTPAAKKSRARKEQVEEFTTIIH